MPCAHGELRCPQVAPFLKNAATLRIVPDLAEQSVGCRPGKTADKIPDQISSIRIFAKFTKYGKCLDDVPGVNPPPVCTH